MDRGRRRVRPDHRRDPDRTGPRYGYQSLAAYGLPAEAALAAYRARYPQAVPGDLLAPVQTDWWMRIPAIRLADAHAGTAARGTYMYEFAWASPGLGAVHALEVPFVFDTVGPDAPLFGPLLGTDAPQELADAMHGAWVAFAASGDPGWPRYDLGRPGDDAVRHDVAGGARPPCVGAGALGGRPMTRHGASRRGRTEAGS